MSLKHLSSCACIVHHAIPFQWLCYRSEIFALFSRETLGKLFKETPIFLVNPVTIWLCLAGGCSKKIIFLIFVPLTVKVSAQVTWLSRTNLRDDVKLIAKFSESKNNSSFSINRDYLVFTGLSRWEEIIEVLCDDMIRLLRWIKLKLFLRIVFIKCRSGFNATRGWLLVSFVFISPLRTCFFCFGWARSLGGLLILWQVFTRIVMVTLFLSFDQLVKRSGLEVVSRLGIAVTAFPID